MLFFHITHISSPFGCKILTVVIEGSRSECVRHQTQPTRSNCDFFSLARNPHLPDECCVVIFFLAQYKKKLSWGEKKFNVHYAHHRRRRQERKTIESNRRTKNLIYIISTAKERGRRRNWKKMSFIRFYRALMRLMEFNVKKHDRWRDKAASRCWGMVELETWDDDTHFWFFSYWNFCCSCIHFIFFVEKVHWTGTTARDSYADGRYLFSRGFLLDFTDHDDSYRTDSLYWIIQSFTNIVTILKIS